MSMLPFSSLASGGPVSIDDKDGVQNGFEDLVRDTHVAELEAILPPPLFVVILPALPFINE